MANLDPSLVDVLARTRQVDIRTPRRDGSTSSRPVWVVVVDGRAYVRSWLGERGAWYRRARADGRAALAAGDVELPVGVVPVEDDELNARVSDAFRAKYGKRSPRSTEQMVTPEVEAATLEITTREGG